MSYKFLRRLKLDKYELESDTRENFESIEDYILNETMSKVGWQFAEITIPRDFTSGSPYLFKHNASFIPKDVLITSVSNLPDESTVGTVAVLYNQIDKDFIYFSCTSPGAIVRFFYGVFREQRR